MSYLNTGHYLFKFLGLNWEWFVLAYFCSITVAITQPLPMDSLPMGRALSLEVFWHDDETHPVPAWEPVGAPIHLRPPTGKASQLTPTDFFTEKNLFDFRTAPQTFIHQTIDHEKTEVIGRRSSPISVQDLFYSELSNYNIGYLDANHGLPDNYPNALLQSTTGDIWIHTNIYGLMNYDGHRLQAIRGNYGLPHDEVKAMAEDNLGNIWIAASSGLKRFDGKTFTQFRLEGLNNLNVTDIAIDTTGKLWFATEQHGILWFNNLNFEQLSLEGGKPLPAIKSLAAHPSGTIWAVSEEGLLSVTDSNIIGYHFPDILAPESIVVSDDGEIWWGDKEGINSLRSGSTAARFIFPKTVDIGNVQALAYDSVGVLWIGTQEAGLWQFDGVKLKHFSQQKGMKSETIRQILIDREGHIWAINSGFGINKINPVGIHPKGGVEEVLLNNIHRAYQDSLGNNWLATSDMGLLMFDGENYSQYGVRQGIPQGYLLFLTPSQEGHLWLGYHKEKLVEFDGQRKRSFNNGYFNVKEDRKGQKWMAKENGVLIFDGNQFGTPRVMGKYTLTNIYQINSDPEKNIWLYFNDGNLGKVVGDSITFFQSSRLSTITDHEFWMEDPQDIWILPFIDQFLVFTKTGPPKRFRLPANLALPHGHYWDYKGNLWLTTDQGPILCTPNPDPALDQEWQHFTYDKGDGLQNLNLGSGVHFDINGLLWFPSNKVQHYLHLKSLYHSMEAPAPSVSFSGMQIAEHFVDFNFLEADVRDSLELGNLKFTPLAEREILPNNLKLPYFDNSLTFQFTSKTFNPLAKVLYQYRMIGLSDQWSNPTKESAIDYRGISPGDYSFQVRARNGLSEWGPIATYSFQITPPWWRSNLALSIYGLLISLGLTLIYHFLKRRLVLEHQLKIEQTEKERLKELDHFKTRLYTNITHEFRTPLTVILGMVDQMQESPKKYLNKGFELIERNSRNLLQLINQLLDLSKLESNAFQLKQVQGNLVQYLRYLTESFQTYTNGHNLSLRFFSTLEEVVMDYDPEQVKQVFNNLISNAVKFTPSGGHIQVSLTKVEQNLQLQVEDTGIGIADEDLPSIFDRFHQLDNSSTRKTEGTGLGLAHTRELVKLMGGHIQVESKIDQGTTFIISLPITNNGPVVGKSDWPKVIDPPDNLNAQRETIDVLEKTVSGQERHQLLIIEDNHDVVVYLRSCLEDLYQIDVAFNGKIGIEKALDSVPDIIISDVMMPEKDGYEVCETLKNDERTSHIPIILLTAKADTSFKIRGLRTGADVYLAKPFNKIELLVRLQMMVRKQQRLQRHFARKFQHGFSTEIMNPDTDTVLPKEHFFVRKVRQILEENYHYEDFALPMLCQKMRMSRSQLYRKMKALINTSPSDFIRLYRLEKAMQLLLADNNLTVSEVAWKVGFKDTSHFSKAFNDAYGFRPGATNR